jgi:RNA 3'-terminal phosphate cyclase (ATP)
MIEIDGSHGEGGGQILRTSLSLSVLTGKSVKIHHVRSGRKKPGLKPQHVISAHAVAHISGGRLGGAELESKELTFHPGRIKPGDYNFDVTTLKASAGSAGLIFQTLLAPLAFAGGASRVIIQGGTHVTWSPPADYLREVFLPAVAAMGLQVKMEINRHGFYPIGGGILEVLVTPLHLPLAPLWIEERGDLKKLSVVSKVANLTSSIGQRQLDRAMTRLTKWGSKLHGKTQIVESSGKGTFLFVLAEFDRVRAGFSALGEIGKRAEEVADEAVDAFLRFWNAQGTMDPYLADQLILYMALAQGVSAVTFSKMTDHLKTNIWVIEQFLPLKFIIEEDPAGSGRVTVSGVGFRNAS